MAVAFARRQQENVVFGVRHGTYTMPGFWTAWPPWSIHCLTIRGYGILIIPAPALRCAVRYVQPLEECRPYPFGKT